MPDSKSGDIFRKLVSSASDIVGGIAFSIYKQEEIDFVESYKRDQDRLPDEKEWDSFFKTFTDSKIERITDEASLIFSNGISQILEDEFNKKINETSDLFLENLKNDVREAVKEESPGRLDTIIWGATASAVFAIVMSACICIMDAAKIFTLKIPIYPYEVHLNPVSINQPTSEKTTTLDPQNPADIFETNPPAPAVSPESIP